MSAQRGMSARISGLPTGSRCPQTCSRSLQSIAGTARQRNGLNNLKVVSRRLFSARGLLSGRGCKPPCAAFAHPAAPTPTALSTTHRGVGAIGVPDSSIACVRRAPCRGSNVHTADVPLVHRPSPPPIGSSALSCSAPPGTRCSPARATARSPESTNAPPPPS